MLDDACCTCATLLSSISPQYDEKSEKAVPSQERRLECCGRIICGRCKNPRFATYCPFCQVSTTPSTLPQGLRNPPAYSPPPSPRLAHAVLVTRPDPAEEPPAYSAHIAPHVKLPLTEKIAPPAPDVLHFLDPAHDTLSSLSLRYGVPAAVVRSTNGLYADHLLAARRTVLIPGSHYKGGVSLSPRPVGGEDEELRKAKIRRWMVACKVAEYDVAQLYLKQTDYDLDAAVDAYKADERWEKEHPMESAAKGKSNANSRDGRKGRRNRFGSGLVGQLS
ncbi:MAG: hypothetical protein M1832_005043 [Thelocarpon impressellum]|nr:MAG: hypothetical protein M1832_005043 [Thelocarpon impressellum]